MTQENLEVGTLVNAVLSDGLTYKGVIERIAPGGYHVKMDYGIMFVEQNCVSLREEEMKYKERSPVWYSDGTSGCRVKGTVQSISDVVSKTYDVVLEGIGYVITREENLTPREEPAAFSIGDLVMLNSGGPQMTVSKHSGDGYPMCRWFDCGDMLQTEEFHPDCLKRVEESNK